MNRKFKLIMGIALIFIMLIGCSNKDNEDSLESSREENAIESAFDEQSDESVMGSFEFGPVFDGEKKAFLYTGQEVQIPFKVTGLSETVSDFGLIMFVDGNAQPFKLLYADGTYSEEGIMHKFSLHNEEVKAFNLAFLPIVGKKGDKVGIEFATVFKPDFKPEDKEKSNYSNYHDLSSTIPQELYFETGISNSTVKSFNPFKEEEIPNSIIEENTRPNSAVSKLDHKMATQLLPEGEETDFNKNVFTSKDHKIKFRFRMMGGANDMNYRTYIYINHEPVKIMGYNCLDSNVKKGKMLTAELELDTTGFDELSTIYAISNPVGDDYMSSYSFAVKTLSGLVVVD